MIFLTIGILLLLIGLLFLVFPSKGNLPFYGYRSPLAAKSDAHWRLAQRTSGLYFLLMGALMALIGYWLRMTEHTNYFLIEMLLLVFPIMPIFILTERKLQKFDRETGGHDDEYFND
ncbi:MULTISPECIES: SdpI family protein [unclassified Enterococcus]|uniref:SdpI family protein n=1 Tax=unclassified Enterococcus TaxID=2608891 RepID=UPI0013EA02CB|nr:MULTISPECIES: SdpI family protein [unclassified Enterococcus]